MLKLARDIQDFYQICAERELRVTPQRTALFEIMLAAEDHPTAEAVYRRARKRLPNISYDTVNRTLLIFVKYGIIRLVQSRGSAKRYDPNLSQHHHFQCVKCQRIIDFEEEKYNHIGPPTHLPKGTVILEKKVVLEGICEQCRK